MSDNAVAEFGRRRLQLTDGILVKISEYLLGREGERVTTERCVLEASTTQTEREQAATAEPKSKIETSSGTAGETSPAVLGGPGDPGSPSTPLPDRDVDAGMGSSRKGIRIAQDGSRCTVGCSVRGAEPGPGGVY